MTGREPAEAEERPPSGLRELAAAAAEAFLGPGTALELLGHGQSLTHRVVSARGEHLLRVHVPGRPLAGEDFDSVRAIESECAWLRALLDDTPLVVPEPIPSPRGGWVLELPHPDGAGAVPCTLLTWVRGEVPEGPPDAPGAARLGELLATLHEHARRWRPPPGFFRPTHRPEAWREALARVDRWAPPGVASAADRALHRRAVERLERELAPLAADPDRVGLIHADLHRGNVVLDGGALRPIDFGRSGYGPWLYDVAECLTSLPPARRRDAVDAYTRRRPLARGDLCRIEGYFLASLVEVFGNQAPYPDEHEYLSRAIPAWAPHVERYVGGRPFLFEL